MYHFISKIKLAGFMLAGFALFIFTQPLHAEGWKLNYSASMNGEMQHIAANYSFFEDASDSSSQSSGGNSDILSGGSEKPSDIKRHFSLGVGASRVVDTFRLGPFSPGYGFFAKFSHAKAEMPEGAGIFVDPIVITSNALTIGASGFMRSDPIAGRLVFETGVELSATHSREKFELGTWDIKERSNITRGTVYAQVDYQFADISMNKNKTLIPSSYLRIEHSKGINQALFGVRVTY